MSPTPFSSSPTGPRLLTLKPPGIGQEFYRDASGPATDDTSNKVGVTRVHASAKKSGGIELLGPPPFEAVKV